MRVGGETPVMRDFPKKVFFAWMEKIAIFFRAGGKDNVRPSPSPLVAL